MEQRSSAAYTRAGEEFSAALEDADQITGIPGASALLAGLTRAAPAEGGVCPYCGWTDEKYSATGYVGCALCYSALPSLAKPRG